MVDPTEYTKEQHENRGSESGVAEDSVILSCDAETLCKCFLTF